MAFTLDNEAGDVADNDDGVDDDFKSLLDLVAAATVALRAATMRASMTRISDDDDDGGSSMPPVLMASTSSVRQVDEANAHRTFANSHGMFFSGG